MLAKLSSIVMVLRVLAQLVLNISDFIILAEESDPDNGVKNGEIKKEAVLELIEAIYTPLQELFKLPLSLEKILEISDSIIEILVKLYNMLGFFREITGRQIAVEKKVEDSTH